MIEIPANWKEHEEKCCSVHGCKLGEDGCNIAKGQTEQNGPCEDCDVNTDFVSKLQIGDPVFVMTRILKIGDNANTVMVMPVGGYQPVANHEIRPI